MDRLLAIMELYKEGFNEKVSIGESIEYMGAKYIVIRILEVKKLWGSKSISLTVKVLVQNVGEPSNYRNYKKEAVLTDRYTQSKDDKRIIKTGEIIIFKEGIAYEVVSINRFRYEFVDLIVDYSVRLIVPWSQEEVNEALREERKSTFKVLEGGKVWFVP
ncbi:MULTISPECIES: hypothetical protein [unclassified Enterococcus]|uniref:hypothetical protein n=1 Tax=unclassified Enterococcus TaxID=2608891 RepID=UPI0013ECFBE9|nr:MULTISPECIES: hypothetical protein [unclassified Enterococcus]